MTSVFKNTREKITVHFIHDSTLNNIDKKKFLALAEKFDQKIIFYNVDELVPDLISQLEMKMPRINRMMSVEKPDVRKVRKSCIKSLLVSRKQKM